MAVERTGDLSAAEWLRRTTYGQEDKGPESASLGVRVDTCLPGFESYAKVFHPILVEETSVRCLWKDLAQTYGLQFHAEINDRFFLPAFPGRHFSKGLRGPDEGQLDDATCRAIVDILAPLTGQQTCFFYYSGISVNPYEPRLYRALLDDLPLFADDEGLMALPEYWWAPRRSWGILTDWDLRFTLIGGSTGLVRQFIEDPSLECLRVEGSHRVDDYADARNFRVCVRQVAEQVLNGSLSVSQGAEALVLLQMVGCKEREPALSVFREISNAIREIPLGAERQHWAPEPLAKKDADLRRLESQYRASALLACREILAKF